MLQYLKTLSHTKPRNTLDRVANLTKVSLLIFAWILTPITKFDTLGWIAIVMILISEIIDRIQFYNDLDLHTPQKEMDKSLETLMTPKD